MYIISSNVLFKNKSQSESVLFELGYFKRIPQWKLHLNIRWDKVSDVWGNGPCECLSANKKGLLSTAFLFSLLITYIRWWTPAIWCFCQMDQYKLIMIRHDLMGDWCSVVSVLWSEKHSLCVCVCVSVCDRLHGSGWKWQFICGGDITCVRVGQKQPVPLGGRKRLLSSWKIHLTSFT